MSINIIAMVKPKIDPLTLISHHNLTLNETREIILHEIPNVASLPDVSGNRSWLAMAKHSNNF